MASRFLSSPEEHCAVITAFSDTVVPSSCFLRCGEPTRGETKLSANGRRHQIIPPKYNRDICVNMNAALPEGPISLVRAWLRTCANRYKRLLCQVYGGMKTIRKTPELEHWVLALLSASKTSKNAYA
jgi:hypothetical protein